MNKTSKLLLAALLVVNLAAVGAVGLVTYKVNDLVVSMETTKNTLDETGAFLRSSIQQTRQRVDQLDRDAQDIQERLKRINPLAR